MRSPWRTKTAVLWAGEKRTEIDSPWEQAKATSRSADAGGAALQAHSRVAASNVGADAFMEISLLKRARQARQVLRP